VYEELMGTNPSAFSGPDTQPVDGVTWHEAVAYCQALTAAEDAAGRLPEGYVYRLPTEAEWEYACRADTVTPFHLGEELRSGKANFDGTREYSLAEGGTVANPAGRDVPRPVPAGLKYHPSNPWGLSDLIGNLGEWCLDRIDHYPEGPVTDPYTPGPTEEQGAVVRGGAWGDPASACRSAARDFRPPGTGDNHVGFRVVLGRPME
jgi:formylglycine-generating enzyme required for sulfatase activity